MKHKVKAAASLFLVALLLVFNTQIAFALTDETIIYNMEMPTLYESAGPNVESLETANPDINIDEFREYLINGFASCPESVIIYNFKIPNTSSNIEAIRSYIWYETPELFHIKGLGYSTMGGYIYAIYASYNRTADVYAEHLAEFKKNADILTKGIKGNENLTDVEKALLLHDRLAVWCEYTTGTANADTKYQAYGALVKGSAVCMGYALAYDYLLLQVGIDSYYCASDVLNHAWNIVYIDGNKYHVDVTWDDPTYDKSGRVKHTNFLRSTDGLISTGHTSSGGIDYDSSPTDTTYDNYYWQNSNTAFQLIGDDIYYIDNTAATLNKISNGTTTTCKSVSNRWWASSNSYWTGNYATLSSDGENLLYALSTAVYKYDVETGISEVIYTPDFSAGDYYYIYGFKYQNCELICEVYNTPNFQSTTKAENTQKQEYHRYEWITDDSGLKYEKCANCGKISKIDAGSAEIVTGIGSTIVNNDKKLIFTDAYSCCDIADFATVHPEFDVTVTTITTPVIGTGTEILIKLDDIEVCTYTVIVNGDTNGDSVCDVLDAQETQLFATSRKTPTTIQIYAANGDVAETIDINTYQKVVNLALA